MRNRQMAASIASTVGLGLLFASKLAWAQIDPNAGGRPFGGFAATVPGLIEAEDYDLGGEGVAYSETTTRNIGNALRTDEAVDVYHLGTGFIVGSTFTGEYLRYTVDVTEDVEAFLFTFRVASSLNTGKFRIVAGGTGCGDFVVDLTQKVSVPVTGGFLKADYIDIEREGQGLKAGPNVLWLCVEGSYFNIDYFMMTARGAFGGVPAAVPGVIEAERFDEGGEGVAYTETTARNIGNALRTDEAVDVYHLGTGFIVGSTFAGEYLRYTVDVTEDVEAFLFTFRVASSLNTGKFRIVAGGTGCGDFVVDLTQKVSVPFTGGFLKADYIDIEREGQGLKAGPNVLWLCVEGSYFNIDYFSMTARGAFGGVPAAVPGVIEAERFDVGGEGVAYTETTARNIGNALRTDEAVDVYHLGTGFIVGSTFAGEYLRYTVDVTEDVEAFLFTFRVASSLNTGKFRIVAGGTGCGDFVVDLTQKVSVPFTGGFLKADYIDIEREGQGLKAGPNVLWLCVEGSYFNIDYITMTARGAFGGVPAAVPGVIEAERFDVGGEGVAYTETTARNIGNALRTDEAVDVYHLGTGFIVGSTFAGEYLRYTVDVTKDVEAFLFTFRVASDRSTGGFRIVAGGTGCKDFEVDLTQKVSVPATGGFSKANYINIEREGQGLKAGPNVLWLCVEGSYFNIDSFTMTAYDSSMP